MRRFIGQVEIVQQRLRIGGLEIDHPRERALEVRVVGIESFNDELRVVVVLGKDDGLAEPVAGGNLQPVRHQVLEHLVDGVGVDSRHKPLDARHLSARDHSNRPVDRRGSARRVELDHDSDGARAGLHGVHGDGQFHG